MEESITVDDVVDLINELISIDPDAMLKLFNTRIHCNDKLADHPTIQVRGYELKGDDIKLPNMGILGILNGLFGVDEEGRGPFELTVDLDGDEKLLMKKRT